MMWCLYIFIDDYEETIQIAYTISIGVPKLKKKEKQQIS